MSSLNPCNHRFTKENHKRRKICQWNDMLTFLRNNKIFSQTKYFSFRFRFKMLIHLCNKLLPFLDERISFLECLTFKRYFAETFVSVSILQGFKTWSGICVRDRMLTLLISSLIISSFQIYKGNLINKMPKVIIFLLHKDKGKVR